MENNILVESMHLHFQSTASMETINSSINHSIFNYYALRTVFSKHVFSNELNPLFLKGTNLLSAACTSIFNCITIQTYEQHHH